jgi:hypothetical protein
MIATFGDGISTSTGTSLTVNQGIRTLTPVREESRRINGAREYSQDGHSEGEPEVLLSQYPDTIGVPLVFIEVVAVPQHNEYPSWEAGSDAANHLAGEHNVLKARPILIFKGKDKSPGDAPT